jgi:GNAT superfamily N-acetyltransferase
MKIIRVEDKRTRKMFLDTAREIYRNDPVWVCPFDMEIEAIFDPAKNTYFKRGEADRYVLEDDNGTLIGRIAVFIDRNLAFSYDQPTGGIGFFECMDNKEAAFLLFDTAREWLKARGMEAMDGPVNFGETDKYWGLLVEGFTHPSFEVPYNPPYYQALFEEYGFQTYYKMEGFHLDLTKPMSDRFRKIAEWIAAKPGYEFRHFSWRNQAKMTEDFAKVFNEAWATFKLHFEPLEADYINGVLRKARIIIDEEFIWFAYYEGKPIAVFLMYPDLNQILRHLNGKMNLLNMIKFLYLKKTRTMTRLKVLLMGVIPKYQGLGIESAFIINLLNKLQRKNHYTEAEFTWVADFNPRMRKIFVSVGGAPAKHYITYRFLFDRTKEFRRHPIPDIRF